MKSLSFCFKIHQPFRLKRYRFFDIGNDHYYYDDFADDEIISRVAASSYIPMAKVLLEMIEKSNKKFKFAVMISGTAIEQFQLYVPEVIDLFKQLADTGCMEILSGTYSHSLASLENVEEFVRDVKLHDETIYRVFGLKPKTFANTELIYDDDIALIIKSMGFESAITEGAKHILGWKSPNYLYSASSVPSLKLLFTNSKLSRDITRNFNNPHWHEYPLTADKYMSWIAALPKEEQVVNLCMSLDTFGTFLPESCGIFEFMKALPHFAKEMNVEFATPSEISKKLKPVGEMVVMHPISGVDEARDVSAWMGNELQKEALRKLYDLSERVNLCHDRRLKQDWEYLQSSDHFYYMSTKNLDDGASHAAFSPYDSPYSAFTNYMNVLADFTVRVDGQFPQEIGNEELNSLLLTIKNQASEIEELNKKMASLRTNILNADDTVYSKVEAEPKETAPAAKTVAPAPKKSASKKAASATKKAAPSARKPAPAKKAPKK
ncbi:MAG: glycoside hydrolase family 57 protein [Muribaculaceae bacterium]|nr:glycoside hydrolase family 57 protein [Muribaculaceae bacterium]